MKTVSIMVCLLLVIYITIGSTAELQLIDAKKSGIDGGVYSCEGLGDINNDGYADFLLGLWISNELQLYLGGPAPFDNPPAITWPNHGSPSGFSPFSPVNVGDVDCDGVNDFISVFGGVDTLKLFLGLENLDANDYILMHGDSLANLNGFRICGGGDNNNDGGNDLWISRYKFIDTLYGYTGCNLLDSIPDFRIIPAINPDNKYIGMGIGLCSTCDLNGDSIPEIIYGQPTGYSAYPGRVCVTWGDEVLSEEPDLVFYGNPGISGNEDFGISIACLGDVSGDGIDDLWVSQGIYNFIYNGGTTFDTIPDFTMHYEYMYGFKTTNVGDINHDGYNDMLLGLNGGLFSFVSYIYCYPGMDSLVDAVFSNDDFYAALNDGSVDYLGYDISWCGDVDGDGIDDALITAQTIRQEGRAIIQSGWEEPTAVDDEWVPAILDRLELKQNHPNPFNSGTIIEFTLPRSGFTEITILNVLGEVIAKPLSKTLSAGEHQIHWDGKDSNGRSTATGVYFYRVTSGDFSETKKMILLE